MNNLQNLIAYMKVQYHNFNVLHRHLNADICWLENHDELGEWGECIASQIDELCEMAQTMGYTEPSIKDAVLAFANDVIVSQFRDVQETFTIARTAMHNFIEKLKAAENDVPPFVTGKLQDMEYKWKIIADYKLARVMWRNTKTHNTNINYDDD